MAQHTRRDFLRTAAAVGAGLAVAPAAFAAPTVLTPRRTPVRTAAGTLVFEPHYVQRGRGPHLNWAYATDEQWDTFHSNIEGTEARGVMISDAEGRERFGVNTQWHVEGFGYVFITADAGGAFYELPPEGETRRLNLNVELARSRVARNRTRLARHTEFGRWRPSRELSTYVALSEGYLEDADRVQGDERRRGELAQQALYYAMWAGEMMELEKARAEILRRGPRSDLFLGCDARSFYQMDPDRFVERFSDLFDYANVTYVVGSDQTMGNFEPVEGRKMFDRHDPVVDRLRRAGVTTAGRPLFWFHHWVTPDWLRAMSYDQLKGYVERHTREVVRHYGDRMYAWEITNEFHDWANDVQVTPEQAVELTKLACEVARAEAPNVHRLINLCCPYAEYVQMGEWSGQKAKYPQRTPWQYVRDLDDAGVDFTLTGIQMYYPGRDLQDILAFVERFEAFARPVQLSEVDCPGGPSERSIKLGTYGVQTEGRYDWHRHWDEELQADWLEGVYTMAYSKPYVNAINWFDFLDTHSYIENGGLFRTRALEEKASYHRLKKLQAEWAALPEPIDTGCSGCN